MGIADSNESELPLVSQAALTQGGCLALQDSLRRIPPGGTRWRRCGRFGSRRWQLRNLAGLNCSKSRGLAPPCTSAKTQQNRDSRQTARSASHLINIPTQTTNPEAPRKSCQGLTRLKCHNGRDSIPGGQMLQKSDAILTRSDNAKVPQNCSQRLPETDVIWKFKIWSILKTSLSITADVDFNLWRLWVH